MDDLKKAITNITKTITKTSGDLLKTTKVSMNIANEESALRDIYTDIGKKVHEIYAYGGSLGQFFDEKYIEIQTKELKIKGLKEELDDAKGTKTCPSCKKSAPNTSEFCPKCGAAMDIDIKKNEEKECVINKNEEKKMSKSEGIKNLGSSSVGKVSEISNKKRCSVCNYTNAENEKFCISCGRLL